MILWTSLVQEKKLFKDFFLLLALAAILLNRAKPICAILVEGIMGKIHVNSCEIILNSGDGV